MTANLLGGLGFFLLGMVLLTDGLKSAAGDSLREVLTRFTGGPFKALLSGVAVTTLVQSSSATTLTTIGFVSAGLLTFPQAIGVIFGANLGTTSTAWLVSIVGLKLQIGTFALPLVAFGAVLRLLGRGRAPAFGMALAGFGLLFVGIDALQDGMAGLAARIDPASLPGATLSGRLILVGVGMAMTVVMQSSSAAIATTLAALHTGTITLEQGAALAIGQNVGTTVKVAFASIGASIPARRTAVAHIVFNVLTGIVAFAILPLVLWVAQQIGGGEVADGPATLAAFHSVFNVLGVVLLLPWVGRLAATIERVVPEPVPTLARHLDASLLGLPPVAIEAVRRALCEMLRETLEVVVAAADGALTPAQRDARLVPVREALLETRRFIGRVRTSPDDHQQFSRHVSVVHAADHTGRLVRACEEATTDILASEPPLRSAVQHLEWGATTAHRWLQSNGEAPISMLQDTAQTLHDLRQSHRQALLQRVARGDDSPDVAARQIDIMRWLERVSHHMWRAAYHLAEPDAEAGQANGGEDAALPADGAA
jgi:phosphate:Na+ symporter